MNNNSPKPDRFNIEPLEQRIAPAHLGHIVDLPQAASNGDAGLQSAGAAPADHHRALLRVKINE